MEMKMDLENFIAFPKTSKQKRALTFAIKRTKALKTLKRFYKEATRIRLQPANASMQPIFVKNVRIQGKVVGLVRKYKN